VHQAGRDLHAYDVKRLLAELRATAGGSAATRLICYAQRRPLDKRVQGRLTMHKEWKRKHREGDVMSSSGAYAIPIDPAPGGGPGAEIQRVVPLPPVHNAGAISFNLGWLSLAYDDFGAGPPSVDVRVRIFNATAGVTMDTTVTFPVGRTVVKELDAGDLTASFQFVPSGGKPVHPVLAALVEYD